MKKEKFEKLVEGALADLPREFKKLIDNLVVIVEEEAPPEVYRKTGSHPFSRILGTYHGVPYTHRGPYYGNIPPDVITIYQKPIEEVCSSEEMIKEQVQKTVLHEIWHYFGRTDKEIDELEKKALKKK
ncbi:MAG: metallopeptidase family protein [Candidatus Aminicenantes bacterium]|nr:MAG: metallopeptidase family protein [Candidatus Aminicenantes bacterium]